MRSEIGVRLLATLDEFRACQAIQKATWNFPDLLIIPYTQLVTMQQNGGAVLGAFDGGELVGFVCGFLGREGDGPLYLYSQRMGVLAGQQGKGIGERLKWAQRDWALAHGLDRVVWTYDPLEPANARLNLAKLGGLARRYKRDIYGEHESSLHSGVPTDRLVIDWELTTERVLRCRAAAGGPPNAAPPAAGTPANRVWWDERGLPHTERLEPALPAGGGARLLLTVPADWQALRAADLGLAREWRARTREAFEVLLGQGYVAVGYGAAPAAPGARRHNFYILERA